MKNFKRGLFLLILLSVLLSCNGVKDGHYELNIYATNDLHGRLFDTLYIQNNQNVSHPYSLSSVSAYIKEVREYYNGKGVVLLDIGDHLQGDNSVFYSNFVDTANKHIFAKVANYLKYDAIVVGNHDIEAGPRVYSKLSDELNAPYLAANAIDINTDKPYFKPYTIIVRDGIRIAVIGMTNPNIPNWLSAELWKDLRFDQIFDSIVYWTEYVTEHEKPHIIIAALHSGLGDVENNSIENPSKYIAANVPGIDIVFAAHDHKTTSELVNNEDRGVWVLEGGSRASSLSHASVKVEIKNGKIISKDIIGRIIPMSDVLPDKEYNNYFKNQFDKIKEFTNRIVGTLNKTITTRDAYFGSSEYIDMIHSIQLESSGADISFAAPLSLDVTVKSGDLNFQDLMNIYPYENQLYVIEMTGQEIKDYLEFSYSKWVNKADQISEGLLQLNISGKGERSRFRNTYFNFDSAAGLLYEVNITKGDGERIKIISDSKGLPFDMSHKYKVALSSYRASGGGDLLEKGAGIPRIELDARIVNRMADIREMIYNKLKREGSITPAKLNHWKFVPEGIVAKLSERDYKKLFDSLPKPDHL